MSLHDVLAFFLPQINDPLQVGFAALIVLMMSATIISTHRYARPISWERKWNRGTANDSSDDLDIEHGSVTDLWHAVATAPEKLAEVMPGLLLVVGLLGTFLGLGLALNHASNILGQPNALSASGATNSMQDLLGMLQGLGTKFKTSTWGITGFVLFKIWSEFTRFDEKRLTWVIGKVKTELESRKKAMADAEDNKQKALLQQISGAAKFIVSGFTKEIDRLIEHDKASAQIICKNHELGFAKASDKIQESLKGVQAQIEQSHAGTRVSIQEGFSNTYKELSRVQIASHATKDAMEAFTKGTQTIVLNMGNSAQRMADGADHVGNAASGLVAAVDDFKSQFTEVLDNVRKDLGTAITDMSTKASETLALGSKQLGDATHEISTALGVLSADVKETMNEVKSSIGKSLEIQKDAQIRFIQSSDSLNENVSESTESINKVTNSIQLGLKSVAEAGQHVRGVGNNLEKSNQSIEEVIKHLLELPTALAPLSSLPSHQKELLSALKPLGIFPEQQAVLHELRRLLENLKLQKMAVEQADTGLATSESLS